MRAYLSIIALSVLLGIGGIVGLSDAVSDYTGTLRTYTQIDVSYEPGTFEWLEADFNRARLTITFQNDSPVQAVIEELDLFLRFDDRFAGANYNRFDDVVIPPGESRSVVQELEVTSNTIQAEGGSATLSLGGSMSIRFAGIERGLTLDVADTIGVVPGDATGQAIGQPS